jgi:hypothetical protein
MKYVPMTRRSFVASAAGAAFMVVLPGCGSESGLGENDRRALLRMARLLYPHDALADDVYTEVLQSLQSRATHDPVLAEALRAGIEELDRAAGRDWRTAPTEDQIEALGRIEGGASFNTVQDAVRAQLYEHPDVWSLIGYEGSSVEYGGYLLRGFDDIDWLPED